MADSDAVLARRYRRLLVAYPHPYRAQRGDEIVATLLDVAEPGRRMPRLADSFDLVVSGLRRRFGSAALSGLDSGLALAAPVSLGLAAGISLFAWWHVEPVTVHTGHPALLGTFRTIGPVAYLVWLVAALAWVHPRPAVGRAAAAVALGVTLAIPAVAPLTPVDRPPLWVLMALSGFGGLALVGPRSATTMDGRLAVPAGAVAVAVCAVAVSRAWPPGPTGDAYYYQPVIARVGTVASAAVALLAGTAAIRLARRRPAREWLWATALIGLPAGWLGPFDTAGLRVLADTPVPHFGRLAQVLVATCVSMVAVAWLAGRPHRPAVLAAAGAGTLGSALGLAGVLVLLTQRVEGFAGATWPRPVTATLVVLAGAGASAWLPGAASWGRKTLVAFGTGLAGAATAGWLVAIYDNGWTLSGWADFPRTAALVSTLSLVPLTVCLVTAVRVLTGRPGHRWEAVGPLVVSAAWLGYLTLPYVFSWGPVLLVLLAAPFLARIMKPTA